MPKKDENERRKKPNFMEQVSNVRTLLLTIVGVIGFVFAGFKVGLVDPVIVQYVDKYHSNFTNTDFQLLKQEISNMHEKLKELTDDNAKLEGLMNDILKILSSGENDVQDYDVFLYNSDIRAPVSGHIKDHRFTGW